MTNEYCRMHGNGKRLRTSGFFFIGRVAGVERCNCRGFHSCHCCRHFCSYCCKPQIDRLQSRGAVRYDVTASSSARWWCLPRASVFLFTTRRRLARLAIESPVPTGASRLLTDVFISFPLLRRLLAAIETDVLGEAVTFIADVGTIDMHKIHSEANFSFADSLSEYTLNSCRRFRDK